MKQPAQPQLEQQGKSGATKRASIVGEQAGFVDDRAAAIAQRRLADMIVQSPRAVAQRKQMAIIEGETAQRKDAEEEDLVQAKFDAIRRVGGPGEELLREKSDPVQRQEEELLQGQFVSVQKVGVPEEELLQRKRASDAAPVQLVEDAAPKANNTGLPDKLKAGIENLSGVAMDDVKVHYNSSAPSQLQALAYAQGSDIHVGPGQEQHLPHEAWHVVQQRQGRVRPTLQAQGSAINDDAGLESEADAMGAKAAMQEGSSFQRKEPEHPDTGKNTPGLTSFSKIRQFVVTRNETTNQWQSDVTGLSYPTREQAETAEAALLADESWPRIKYKLLQYEAEQLEQDRIHDGYIEELSYQDTENEEGAKPLLDRQDAHGLTSLAFKIGYKITKSIPDAIILVAGASPEIIAALIAGLYPAIPQVVVAMSDVKEKHVGAVPDPNIVAYVSKSMGVHATDGKPVVILDATDTGSSIVLLKKVLVHIDRSRKVIPLSINAFESKDAFGEKIQALKTGESDRAINKAKTRFNYQIYKTIFPRLIGKIPIESIIDGSIASTPAADRRQQQHIQAAAKALIQVWASQPLDEATIDEYGAARKKEERTALATKRTEAAAH